MSETEGPVRRALRESLNKQRGSVWRGRSGGSPAMAIPLGEISEGARHQRLWIDIDSTYFYA